MEQLLKEQKKSNSNSSASVSAYGGNEFSVPSSKRVKMNIIDHDDQAIDKLQQSINIKEKSLKNHKTKANFSIMNEMQNSIKKIENKISQDNHEIVNKLKIRVKGLLDEKKQLQDIIGQQKKEMEKMNIEILQFEQKSDEIQTLNQNFSDENQELLEQINDLQKKNQKHKKEAEIIPELKSQLLTMKDALAMLEKEMEEEKTRNMKAQQFQNMLENEYSSTFSKAQDQMGALSQYQKKIEDQETKNYDLIKENINLKDIISELKEEKLKQKQKNEATEQEIKTITSDLIYIFSKLKNLKNSKQDNVHNEKMLQNKYLINEIDSMIEEFLLEFKELKIGNTVFEERISGLKDQNNCLQKIIDKNQELMIDQQNKIKVLEDNERDTKAQLINKQEYDKSLERFKIQIQNQLLNIKHQIEQLQSFSNNKKQKSENKEYNIDQLLDFINERVQITISNEKKLSQKIQEQQNEIERLNEQIMAKIQNFEEKRQIITKEDKEQRNLFTQKIQTLQDELEKTRYEFSYYKIEQDANIKGKEMQLEDIQVKIEMLTDILCSSMKRLKQAQFEKKYMSKKIIRMQDKITQLESGIKNLIPPTNFSEEKQRPKYIKTFKRTVTYIMFAIRLRNNSMQKKNNYINMAMNRILDNYLNERQYWDQYLLQNSQQFKIISDIFNKITNSKPKYKDLQYRNISFSERLPIIEKVKSYINSNLGQCDKLYNKLKEKEELLTLQNQKIQLYEEETLRQFESNERLSNQLSQYQEFNVQEIMEQNKKISKYAIELQEKIDDQEILYQQKVKYLKRDIELKNHQLESLKKLISVKEKDFKRQASEKTITQQQQQTQDDKIYIQVSSNNTNDNASRTVPYNFNYSFSENI